MPRDPNLRHALAPALAVVFTLANGAAGAQTPAPAPAASAPARAASAPGRPASAPAASASQRIEITGGRDSDTEARRQSTASKIVIGREEIDKFGDATVGEVLRRLPGVTTPGAPGRGGPPRMRGLGGGFTQLLIDGQRIPPGFSLESLTPEQIERIEILRAPTAETGARAIAGTINIITREGFKKRLNDVRVGVGLEDGKLSPGATWTHNDSAGDLVYNLSGSLFNPHRRSRNETRTTVENAATGEPLEERTSRSESSETRVGANLTSRLQWRLGEAGDMLALMPNLFRGSGRTDSTFTLDPTLSRPPCTPTQVEGCTPEFYRNGDMRIDSSFTNARLGAQWRQRVGSTRVELNGGLGRFRGSNRSLRNEYGTPEATHTYDDSTTSRDTSLTLNLKASQLTGGSEAGGGEHSLVGGIEIDTSRRKETRLQLQDGEEQYTDFDNNLQASVLRLAAFAQDEWQLNPHWSAHAGLRWEGITTRGDSGEGERPTNRSSVVTPLLHAVWKPDPRGRDQLRVSLTRSYRSPNLATLVARPTINRIQPAGQPNSENFADSAGNPNLKPELARGVDIAVERYLQGGGVLSANLVHRNITNLIRNRTELEDVSWSTFPRWVRRQRNIGGATMSGLELDAKFRLDQLFAGATPVELRSNFAMYTSRVKGVPGPDNRLDEQAKATANFGADYRLRGVPLTLGGNFNWVPGYTTRLDVDQTRTVSTKQVWDAFALWTFGPTVGLRLLGNNLTARDYETVNVNDTVVAGTTERNTSRSGGPSYVNWQLRLELKL